MKTADALANMLICSLALAIGAVLAPVVVLADEAAGLQEQTASIDSSQPRTEVDSGERADSGSRVLQGGVKKRGILNTGNGQSVQPTDAAKADDRQPLKADVKENDAQLQMEQALADAQKRAIEKLQSGAKMTSDDYRDLQVGVTGIESTKFPFQKYGRVTAIYKGSPADEAGIRKGEKEVWENVKLKTGQTLQVSFTPVGKPVPVRIMRHGEKVVFTLIAQNMEDIQEPKIRHMWEKMIHNLGYPKQGIFVGHNLHDLSEAK